MRILTHTNTSFLVFFTHNAQLIPWSLIPKKVRDIVMKSIKGKWSDRGLSDPKIRQIVERDWWAVKLRKAKIDYHDTKIEDQNTKIDCQVIRIDYLVIKIDCQDTKIDYQDTKIENT